MYKYKKYTIRIITVSYIILTLIEFIKYMFTDSNFYGLLYMLLTFIILFLLVPVCLNYKKYYSGARISKLILIILIGLFTSYILNIIVINNMNYIDSSNTYKDSIFIIKNIMKPILYFILTIFTLLEFKLDKIIMKNISKIK